MFSIPQLRSCVMEIVYTVKPVLTGHSQKDRKMVFKTNYRLMQVKSIAECSNSLNIFLLPNIYSNGVGSQVLTTLVTTLPLHFKHT